jgi:hypothetical protein
MSAAFKPLSEGIVSLMLFRWAAAVCAQQARLLVGLKSLSNRNDEFETGDGDIWSDSILLLEAMSQFYRWYDHATHFWNNVPSMAPLDVQIRKHVEDLRKMTIHMDGFIQGKGRGTAQSRFVADTPFQHDASGMIYSLERGVVIGGRLERFRFNPAHIQQH